MVCVCVCGWDWYLPKRLYVLVTAVTGPCLATRSSNVVSAIYGAYPPILGVQSNFVHSCSHGLLLRKRRLNSVRNWTNSTVKGDLLIVLEN